MSLQKKIRLSKWQKSYISNHLIPKMKSKQVGRRIACREGAVLRVCNGYVNYNAPQRRFTDVEAETHELHQVILLTKKKNASFWPADINRMKNHWQHYMQGSLESRFLFTVDSTMIHNPEENVVSIYLSCKGKDTYAVKEVATYACMFENVKDLLIDDMCTFDDKLTLNLFKTMYAKIESHTVYNLWGETKNLAIETSKYPHNYR